MSGEACATDATGVYQAIVPQTPDEHRHGEHANVGNEPTGSATIDDFAMAQSAPSEPGQNRLLPIRYPIPDQSAGIAAPMPKKAIKKIVKASMGGLLALSPTTAIDYRVSEQRCRSTDERRTTTGGLTS
jgi:hypothetical protein